MGFPNRGEGGSPTWEKFSHFPGFFLADVPKQVIEKERELIENDPDLEVVDEVEGSGNRGGLGGGGESQEDGDHFHPGCDLT